jgi:tRNA (mo5U34)-methyltransferase
MVEISPGKTAGRGISKLPDKAAIEAGLRRLAPFHHDIELPFGLRTRLPDLARRPIEGTRLSNLTGHAWPALLAAAGGSLTGKCVLDVACNCGGFSIEAARSGATSVLGIDIVAKYIEQANFVKQALGIDNATFEQRSLMALDPAKDGIFDVTLCFGILYHLENPVAAMRRIAAVTGPIMLVDTDVVPSPPDGRALWDMNFPAPSKDDSASASVSLWRKGRKVCQFSPNEVAVVELLKFLGFTRIEKLPHRTADLEARYREGRRATFLAQR